MDMIQWLGNWLNNDNTKIVYILILILGASIFDFVIGWFNAKFNPNIEFVSNKATYGIIKKMVYFMLLIYFIPVAMLIPDPVGIGAIYVLYMGYLLSELNSIFSHFGKAEDGGKSDLFITFIKTIFSGKGGSE